MRMKRRSIVEVRGSDLDMPDHRASEHATPAAATEADKPIPPDAVHAFAAAVEAQKIGDVARAEAHYRRAIEISPAYGDAYNNLALLLHGQKKLHASIICLKRALRFTPPSAVLYVNLGNNLRQLNRHEEASDAFRHALELEPEWPEALVRYGHLLEDMGNSDEAIACYDRAIAQRPGDVEMRWVRAMVQLRRGNLVDGFADYEVRLQRKETAISHFTMPIWSNENLGGRTILVHTEQGFGDTIQFIRFLPKLAALGARVLFSCPPEMMRLMAGFPGIARLVVHGAPMPEVVDFHVPLLSLGHRLGITLSAVQTTSPYLTPPPGVEGPAISRGADAGYAVGIAWAGNPAQANDRNRSAPLESFFPLVEMPGIALHSLQKGPRSADLARLGLDIFVRDLSTGLNDFAETAAVMMNVDLSVSVDRAAAHLAGALGRPTFVLLSHRPDWRWMRRREDSPWYPTMTLFRQTAPGDWNGVIERVRARIERIFSA